MLDLLDSMRTAPPVPNVLSGDPSEFNRPTPKLLLGPPTVPVTRILPLSRTKTGESETMKPRFV